MDLHGAPVNLRPTFDGATQFGLTEDEVWGTIDDVMSAVGGGATVAEYLEELNGALAARILAKQRLGPREQPSGRAKRRRNLFGGP